MSAVTEFTTLAPPEVIEETVESLQEHGFRVEALENLAEARQRVEEIIPEGAQVFTATSRTLDSAGITEDVNESDRYRKVRDEIMQYANEPDKAIEQRRVGSAMEYTLGSVHAITQDGQVIVASNSGSQLPGYVYGADHIIWVVSTKKIVKDLQAGLHRLEKHVYPLENARAQQAYGVGSAISKILIYRLDNRQRVTILLVNEDAGF